MRLDIHITREMWEALDEGSLPEEFLRLLLRAHVNALCPTCRREYEDYQAGRPGPSHRPPSSSAAWSAPVPAHRAEGSEDHQAGAPGAATIDRLSRDAEAEQARARRDLAALLALDAVAGDRRIARARKRFRSPFLAELLNSQARRILAHEPARSRQLARWAERVLLERPAVGRFRWRELEMEALILQGDASRRLGELSDAERLFRRARTHVNPLEAGTVGSAAGEPGSGAAGAGEAALAHTALVAPAGASQGVSDLALVAELDWREGTLLGNRGRFRSGEVLLVRSIFLNTLAGRTLRVQSVRLSLAILYHHAGRVENALHLVDEILADLDPDVDPMLYHLARYNRVLCLVDGGRLAEARADAGALEPLARGAGGETMRLHGRWLQGRILLEDDPSRAVPALAEVAAAFQERGEGYPAAFASLDLAVALLKVNDPSRAGKVIRDLPALFAATDLPQEAISALLVAKEVALHGVVSETALRRLREYLAALSRRGEGRAQ